MLFITSLAPTCSSDSWNRGKTNFQPLLCYPSSVALCRGERGALSRVLMSRSSWLGLGSGWHRCLLGAGCTVPASSWLGATPREASVSLNWSVLQPFAKCLLLPHLNFHSEPKSLSPERKRKEKKTPKDQIPSILNYILPPSSEPESHILVRFDQRAAQMQPRAAQGRSTLLQLLALFAFDFEMGSHQG